MGETIGIRNQGCPLPNPQREAGNGSRANVGWIDPFRSQEVGVHKQPIEKNIDAARSHEWSKKIVAQATSCQPDQDLTTTNMPAQVDNLN